MRVLIERICEKWIQIYMNGNEKIDQIEIKPSEAREFLGMAAEAEAERESLWSLAVNREEEDLSLPLLVLDVDGEDRSSCLSRTSLIRFRSTEVTSALDPTPPRSLYIITTTSTPLLSSSLIQIPSHPIITMMLLQ